MASKSNRKTDGARWANRVVHNRTMLMMGALGIVTFLLLFGKLYDLQINRHDEMQERAVNQQTRNAVVTASRGTIYDRNGLALAISATAETVNISPKEIAAFVRNQEKAIEEAAMAAQKKGEFYVAPAVRDQAYIARGLSRILQLDQAYIEQRMEKTNSMYETIKKKAELEMANEVRRFINGEIDAEGEEVPQGQRKRLQGIFLQPDSKRYYPYNSLAANVVGFVNSDNVGGVGLESKYDSTLEGVNGLTVTAKNAAGTDLLYQYEQYYDAQNGSNLVLTLDVNVQSYLEKGIESMVRKFDAKNGATGIIMNVNSGALVGMASYPNYDLNQYGTVTDEKLKQKVAEAQATIESNRSSYETEEAYQTALLDAAEKKALEEIESRKLLLPDGQNGRSGALPENSVSTPAPTPTGPFT